VTKRIGVVGAGTMGWGIAQLGCLGGFETVLHDPMPDALTAGAEKLRAALAKGAERGRWDPAEAEAAAGRLLVAAELAELAGCELIVEAAPERLELKRELFAELERVAGDEAVLATNTSSLSVTAIAAGLERPARVCGMHFFNPPALMKLVEVVAGDATEEPALELVTEVASAMGRTPIRAADAIGFVANRCARPFSLEALRLYGDGISEPEQIDRIVRIGGDYRMGPFELTDLVGVDVNLEVSKSFWEQSFHEPRWQPNPIQAKMVAAGRLGRKAGRGYYEYGDGPHRPDDPAEPPAAAIEHDGPHPVAIEGVGFRAINLAPPALELSGPLDVGFVAIPDLARARVVEIVRGPRTTPEALTAAGQHFTDLGKHVECVLRSAPGLVLGRIVCQLVNEAHFALQQGVAGADDIDTALKLGLNHPRGPFEWCDEIGATTVVATLDALHAELGEERYRVAASLRARAAAESSGDG
jgi:3-hydroxybutyryl-CoA dehydrogenase